MQKPIFAILFALAVLAGCGEQSHPWTDRIAVVERQPNPQDLIAYPADGQSAGVNPPGFTWTPNEKAKTYRLEVRRADVASRAVIATEPQTSTVYASSKPLAPGDYVWQAVYLDANGAPTGASKSRTFKLPESLPLLPMPDVAALKTKLASVRPRLFLTANRTAEIKAAVASGNVRWWKPMLQASDAAIEETLYPEPAGYPTAEFNVDDWRRIYTPGKIGSAHVARLALAYRITGEEKYLEGARRWLLHLASWDPRGSTSHDVPQPNGSSGNDEASMPMLDRMSFAWDWIGDKLTPEERKKVLASMTERGNQVLALLRAQDFLSHPFSNHEGRVLAFLGNAGLAFLGDIPEAEQWLDYVLRCYLTSYPGWGGDQGGWAQGVSYWSSYVYYLTTFAEALRGVTDVDLFRRPFYQNTGYFAVYFQPAYAPRGAFGDGAERGPGESQQVMLERFADAFDDPVLRWNAQAIPVPPPSTAENKWHEWAIEDVGSVLRARANGAPGKAQPPSELDGSRYLSDIGWVAMHSALGDAANDVWALFKSSRFGSFSHSHADQNTFQLNAYGRALLIDSGYYPWYGSAHDGLWTRQTRAHNGILINGRGQPTHRWEASGSIEHYERKGLITLARGQAASAYNLQQTPGMLKMWQKHMKEPVPPLDPEVRTFERTLAFVGSKERPVLIVHDYLVTAKPATFDWLAHALNQMETDSQTGTIYVRDGDARLAVRLVSTVPFRFSQTDRFSVAPEVSQSSRCAASPKDCAARFPNQWHLSARTTQPAAEARFLAVMVPYRASEPQPQISAEKSGDAWILRVNDTVAGAWFGAGRLGKIPLESAPSEARLVLQTAEGGRTDTVVSQ